MDDVSALLVHRRYQPLARLGSGSQGVILRVRDRHDPARPLVAKVRTPGSGDDGALRLEFGVLSRLTMPGIARVRDLAEDERTGAPFLVEDLVEGETAGEYIEQAAAGPARVTRVVRVLAEVAIVLVALHEAGVVHGDIKPAHLRLGDQGITLLDLGSAIAPALGLVGGGFSPAFAAPEVLAGALATPRSDLFSLGQTLRRVLDVPSGQRCRDALPWLAPSLAELLDSLVAADPEARPASALELAAALGARVSAVSPPPPLGREEELARLLDARGARSRFLVGPPGSGKTHLLAEARTSLLLRGASAELARFPDAPPQVIDRCLAMLESAEAAAVLLLDDFDAAPRELRERVLGCDANRTGPRIVAVMTEAPFGAEVVSLGDLPLPKMLVLARRMGASDEPAARALARQAEGRPGWLVAAAGGVPLSWPQVGERTAGMPLGARESVFAVARAGGSLSLSVYNAISPAGSLQQGIARGLLQLRDKNVELCSSALAESLAEALGTPEIAERLADALERSDEDGPRACLAAAKTGGPRDGALQRKAVLLAGRSGDVETEVAAGLALLDGSGASSTERVGLLARLERRTRDALPALRRRLLAHLETTSREDEKLVPLAKRRRADEAAKAGELASARAFGEAATASARALGGAHEIALCLATEGSVALLSADWATAETRLAEAEALLRDDEGDDAEELARLSHNRGVVALYREKPDEAVRAFEDALRRKRSLFDRAGVRACLSNLALAEIRRKQLGRADELLDEAVALARSLRQRSGLAWCLGVRAEIAQKREKPAEARDHADEALAIEGIPDVLRADLTLHRADALAGLGLLAEAEREAASLPPALLAADGWLSSRCSLTLARVAIARDPVRLLAAAKLCLAAVRTARKSGLLDIETEALALLKGARAARLARVSHGWGKDDDAGLDELLVAVGRGEPVAALARALLLPLLRATGAERAFFLYERADGLQVHGLDLDELSLSEAVQRVDPALVPRLFTAAGILREEATFSGRNAGRGSRVGASLRGTAGAVALLFEHRFRTDVGSSVDDARLSRWCLVGGAVARLAEGGRSPDAAVVSVAVTPTSAPDPEATVVPRGTTRVFPEAIGESAPFRAALAALSAALDRDLPVLLTGETGAGKEIFARAIHQHGDRARGPFVAVSCAAIPDALFEGELFGHARGSFTGAERARAGLLASAEGGVLFLDEVGELPKLRQATLLRALETRSFRPVGADEERRFDVRIVAATNRDLDAAVVTGDFRADLLYRLRVLSLVVPSLRDRTGDAMLLFAHFAAKLSAPLQLTSAAAALIARYPFPGNVRELRHLVERLAASGLTKVDVPHLPRALRASTALLAVPPLPAADDARAEIARALAASAGNITHAAAALGITRHGLKKRMLRLGVRGESKDVT